ncbi:hypothetical protein GCM10023205_55030 [Yinghuangia aomiensis]|uniref:VOC domain-containing protein n=1 Tax=Yinghuangia aomiensis TaxID=676205 RepID=A0ABP9HV26_9ACTN
MRRVTGRMALLVLYSARVDECREFYAALGLEFVREQHGRGPVHYAAVLDGGLVVELYPAGARGETGALRLGFTVSAAEGRAAGERFQVTDPDGRIVEVSVAARPAPPPP